MLLKLNGVLLVAVVVTACAVAFALRQFSNAKPEITAPKLFDAGSGPPFFYGCPPEICDKWSTQSDSGFWVVNIPENERFDPSIFDGGMLYAGCFQFECDADAGCFQPEGQEDCFRRCSSDLACEPHQVCACEDSLVCTYPPLKLEPSGMLHHGCFEWLGPLKMRPKRGSRDGGTVH